MGHDLELFGRIALVGLGSAALTVLAVDAFPSTAEKLIAGIVTGVLAGAGRLLLATAVTVLILLMLELRNIPLLRVVDARRFQGRVSTEDVAPHDPSPGEAAPSSTS